MKKRDENVHRILRSVWKEWMSLVNDPVSFLSTRYLIDIALSVIMGAQQRTSFLTRMYHLRPVNCSIEICSTLYENRPYCTIRSSIDELSTRGMFLNWRATNHLEHHWRSLFVRSNSEPLWKQTAWPFVRQSRNCFLFCISFPVSPPPSFHFGRNIFSSYAYWTSSLIVVSLFASVRFEDWLEIMKSWFIMPFDRLMSNLYYLCCAQNFD